METPASTPASLAEELPVVEVVDALDALDAPETLEESDDPASLDPAEVPVDAADASPEDAMALDEASLVASEEEVAVSEDEERRDDEGDAPLDVDVPLATEVDPFDFELPPHAHREAARATAANLEILAIVLQSTAASTMAGPRRPDTFSA